MKCEIASGNFTNFKSSSELNFCQRCKDNFYINLTDNLCYSNNDEETEFYKCAKINKTEEDEYYKCEYCIDGYYLGKIDNRCSTIEGCDLSENENKCIECDGAYCLNLNSFKCFPNDEIISEDKKYYYRCIETNKEGTACEICEDDFILDENGLCIDDFNCIDKKNGICQKCQNDEEGTFCLKKYFG